MAEDTDKNRPRRSVLAALEQARDSVTVAASGFHGQLEEILPTDLRARKTL